MDPQVALYLKKISNTIGILFFWMCINIAFGIMYGYAYFEQGIQLGNIIFYLWLVISAPLLIWYLRKIWKERIHIEE